MDARNDYPNPLLFIAGRWREGGDGERAPVVNPSTGSPIADVPFASTADLDEALASCSASFAPWRAMPAYGRAKIITAAARLLRERAAAIGAVTTLEQGKPVAESTAEALACADIFEWFAEEGRRAYGRVIPSKHSDVRHLALKQPIGPVAAFSPWNFPTTIPARKIAAALAAGCSVIIKPAEETPGSCLALASALDDAGLPKGVLNVVFGQPAQISEHLIASPVIRKVTFTGSTAVGKHLSRLAVDGMKRTTMELGGHAPVIVLDDADVDQAVTLLAAAKFRNAGQICIAPTRFYLQEGVHDRFIAAFAAAAGRLKVGEGLASGTQMGPLANPRRMRAMQEMIADARDCGGEVVCGGRNLDGPGNFWEPTVLADVPDQSRIMNEEPFGPVAAAQRFRTLEEAVAKANRLPYGLAAYAFTQSARHVRVLGESIEAGMVGINFTHLTGPETPFGGIKESGHGSEGGIEGLDGYLETRYVAEG